MCAVCWPPGALEAKQKPKLWCTWTDSDGDGYTDVQEIAIGKNPLVYCAVMRADVNHSGDVTISDLSTVASHFGQAVPPAPVADDQNADQSIAINDLSTMASHFAQSVNSCP